MLAQRREPWSRQYTFNPANRVLQLRATRQRPSVPRGVTLTVSGPSRTVPAVSDEAPRTDAPVTEPAEPPPAVESASAAPDGTRWDLLQRLKAEKATREQMLEKLKASGLDDESARVLVNSVSGALPSEIPSAQLAPGTNVLAPSTFSLSDVGLTGSAAVVGQYWMGFGAAILLALGVATMMTVTELVTLPDDVAFYGLRIGGLLSMGCVAWGLFRYSQGVVIRRK